MQACARRAAGGFGHIMRHGLLALIHITAEGHQRYIQSRLVANRQWMSIEEFIKIFSYNHDLLGNESRRQYIVMF